MKENQAAYAKHKNVSRKTVTSWKQRGLMLFKPDGSVNFDATDRLHRRHILKLVSFPSGVQGRTEPW